MKVNNTKDDINYYPSKGQYFYAKHRYRNDDSINIDFFECVGQDNYSVAGSSNSINKNNIFLFCRLDYDFHPVGEEILNAYGILSTSDNNITIETCFTPFVFRKIPKFGK